MLGSDRVLQRLMALHPKKIDLSLGRIERLLAALGNPQDRLPPAVHVAGTNGKGSTVATLRACLEAAGYRVHAYTSPHLVRFHERIRLAGELIDEDALLALLEECEEANRGAPITFFEITTAAAFLAFARMPADVVLLETGLGGRLDATNVLPGPAATAITPVSLDHQAFLGDTIAAIAGEKAGILKPGVPAIIGPQPAVGSAIEVIYYAEFSPLVNPTDTNTISNIAWDAVVYGALSAASDYYNDDRAGSFEARYKQIAQMLQEQADADELTADAAVRPALLFNNNWSNYDGVEW